MILQCQDGMFYRNPSWELEHFVVQTIDDVLHLLYPREVQLETARRRGCQYGFYFATLNKMDEKQQIIYKDAWRSMTAFQGSPRRAFPKPHHHDGKSMERFEEDGEEIYLWNL